MRRGSIIPKGDEKWLVRVFLGRDATGKRRYLSELVNGGKKDADKKLTALLKDNDNGTIVVRPKETVGEYLDAWLETTVKPSVRPRTYHGYARVVKAYLQPHLGMVKLAKLSPVEVRAMLTKLRARPCPPDRPHGARGAAERAGAGLERPAGTGQRRPRPAGAEGASAEGEEGPAHDPRRPHQRVP